MLCFPSNEFTRASIVILEPVISAWEAKGTWQPPPSFLKKSRSVFTHTFVNSSFILDTTVPVISGGTITTPDNDSTPNYTFSSDEAGTITYGGSCSSTTTFAIVGNNTITLVSLNEETYSDCTITVTDSTGNVSNPITLKLFIVITILKSIFNRVLFYSINWNSKWDNQTIL